MSRPLRLRAAAEERPLVQLAVVDRRAAQGNPQRTGAGGHHRAGVGAVPLRRLLAPAAQGLAGAAEQRVGQRHQPRRQVVEDVVDLRRGPAEALEARVAVAPHRVQGIAQAIQHHPRRAGHGEPEQRGVDRVAAVLQYRFGGCAGDPGLVQFAGIAADQVADTSPRLVQVAGAQGQRHRFGVLAEAAQAERGVQRQGLDQPAEVGKFSERPGQQGQRQYREDPGGHPVAAPADPGIALAGQARAIETALQAIGQAAEGDQRVPALRLAEARIQRHAEDTQQCAHARSPQRFW